MIQYIYFVKCPNCEDEHFDFFDEAKAFALGCLSQKPIITQVEVCRNDFGECTDSSDLGTIWSWEDECKECGPDAEKAGSHILTKADLENVPEHDPEFTELDNSVEVKDDDFYFNNLTEDAKWGVSFKNIKDFNEFTKLCKEIGIKDMGELEYFMEKENATPDNILDKLREYRAELGPDFKIIDECKRKPIPDGMTIEQLVEEMEENEDEVECTWCNDLFPKDECRKEVDLGYLCPRCEAAIKSRGEKLTFVENDYWDFLDEEYYGAPKDLAFYVDEAIHHLIYDLGRDSTAEDFGDEVIGVVERWYDTELDIPEDPQRYAQWCSAILCEVSRQLTTNPKYTELNEAANHDPLDHHDPDYDEDEAADYLADIADRAKDAEYDNALDDYDFFNEDFDDPIDEEAEESIFDGVESVEEVAEVLIKEEEKAIDQYEEAKEKIAEVVKGEDADVVNEILDHIKEEEEEHIEELNELLPEEPENETSEISEEEVEDTESVEESLTEAVMTTCPECGAEKAFDRESGVCNNCGFIL